MFSRLSNPLLVLVPAEFAVAFGSLYAGTWIRFGLNLQAGELLVGPVLPRATSFAVCMVLGLIAMGLYRARQRPTFREGIARVLVGVALGGLAFVLFFYLFPVYNTGRLTVAIAMIGTFLGVTAVRSVMLRLLDHNPVKRRVLVIGSGRVAAKLGMLRRRSDRRRFDLVGFLPGSDAERAFAQESGIGPLFESENDLQHLQFDEIVVGLDDRRGTFPTAQLLRLRYDGVAVRDIVDFLEQETGKIDLDVLHPGWLIFASSGHTRWGFRAAKRILDLLAGTALLCLSAPIFLLVAVGVWIEEGWNAPLLYRQRRVGQGGRVFELLKFRSMGVDAEAATGPLWAARRSDDRVTRTGRVIRRFRVDELPQLVNVIRGEMSIVGPRPERPEFVEKLVAGLPLYDFRHSMQPGLTGWAQLNFPYGASVEDAGEKLKYDLFYIKNAGIVFDLFILIQTLEVVVWGRSMSMAGTRNQDATKEGEPEIAKIPAAVQRKRDVA